MTFGGIKIYYLIHLDFTKHEFKVFEYKKDRRLTANQAWNHIRSNNPNKIGILSLKANIDIYWKLVKELDIDIKHCDRYMTLG